MGNPEKMLLAASAALEHVPGVVPVALSSAYRTSALGPPQPDFLNAALVVETDLTPAELLGALQGIEAALGRRRGVTMGPRTIDLDLLLMGCEKLATPRLCLPHPRLRERAFALVPLLEIWPEASDPESGTPLSKALAAIERQQVGRARPLPLRVVSKDLEHTADRGFSVQGSSLEDLMERAASVLVDLMVDRKRVTERERRVVEAPSDDHVDMMIGLLEEIVFLVDGDSFVPRRVSGMVIGDGTARLAVYGEPSRESMQLTTRVKAVTYHGAEVECSRSDRWTASVVVDV